MSEADGKYVRIQRTSDLPLADDPLNLEIIGAVPGTNVVERTPTGAIRDASVAAAETAIAPQVAQVTADAAAVEATRILVEADKTAAEAARAEAEVSRDAADASAAAALADRIRAGADANAAEGARDAAQDARDVAQATAETIGNMIDNTGAFATSYAGLVTKMLPFEEDARGVVDSGQDPPGPEDGAYQVIDGLLTRVGDTQRQMAGRLVPLELNGTASVGNQWALSSGLGSGGTGGTIISPGGRPSGATIPAGQTGANAFCQLMMPITAAERARIAGREIRIVMGASCSAGFLTAKPLTTGGLRVVLVDGTILTNQGAIEGTTDRDTSFVRTWLYTATGNELQIGGTLQVNGAPGTAGVEHSFTCRSTTWQQVAQAASEATSLADAAVQARLDRVAATAAALVPPVRMSARERLRETGSLSEMFNGATVINVSGRPVGITVPAGQTGNQSYVVPRIRLTQEQTYALTGATIRIRVLATATANFLLEQPFGGNLVRVDFQNGSVSPNAGSQERVEQIGTAIYRDMLYTVTGTEERIAATMQLGTGVVSASARSFQVISLTWEVASVPSTSVETPADFMLRIMLMPYRSGVGSLFADVLGLNFNTGGATALLDAFGRNMGLTFPTGQTGQGSVLRYRLALSSDDLAALTGRTLHLIALYTTSSGFARAHTTAMEVRTASTTRAGAITSVRDEAISPTLRIVEFDYVMLGDEVELRPYLQFTSTTPAAANETILTADIAASVLRTTSPILSPAEETAAWAERRSRAKSAVAATTIASDLLSGAGRYTATQAVTSTIAAAIAAVTDATAVRTYKIDIPPGTYAERSLVPTDYLGLVGRDRARTIIDGSQAASASIADIAAKSTFDADRNVDLDSLTIIMRNGRYAVHDDNNGFYNNRTRRIINCWIEHKGNQEAIDYQTSLGGGGNPAGVWRSTHAYGHGSSSGSRVVVERSTLKGGRAAFQFHNQLAQDDAASVQIDNCALMAGALQGYALTIESLGSGRADWIEINNSTLDGDIYYEPLPWEPTTLDYQPADHSEIRVFGAGNTPAVFRNAEFGRALRIASATTGTGSSIVLSGSAVAVLFGEVYSRAGATGIAGYAWGYSDIQDAVGVGPGRNLFITGLGKRLGDRTGSPVTLTVEVDGGAPIDVVFNGNHTAQSNATILGAINAALGSAAVASEYNVGGRYRPAFRDEERAIQAGSTAILMGMAVAWDTSLRSGRPMTSSDPLSRFLGVAWEDIYPGEFGRVKTSGWLPLGDVLRTGGAALAMGDAFTIDPSKPGYVVSASAPAAGILPVVRPSLGAGLTTLMVGRLAA